MSYKNKRNFKFPIEDEGYKGRIVFEAFGENYKTLPQTAFNAFVDGTTAATKIINDSTNGIVKGASDLLSGVIGDDGANKAKEAKDALVNFRGTNEAERGSAAARVASGRKATLYLPSALQFQDNIEYTNVDLGALGSGVARLISDPNAAMKDTISQATGLGGLSDLAGRGLRSEAAQIASLRLAKGLSPELQGAVETSTGISMNPNRRSSLRGVGVRQFRFAFKMIPTSQREAEEVKSIVQFFREEMYPDTSNEGIDLALRFPSKFRIKMFYANKRIATKILPSFLANVDVSYNSTGMSFHSDGNFQETDISLSFIEERALTKKDILNEVDELSSDYLISAGAG